MSRLYKYVDSEVQEQAKKYEASLKDANMAVFFIGENYDAKQLKIELNQIVAKNLKLVCVLFGKPVFDSGISLQMGLASMIEDGEDAPSKLAKELSEKVSSHKKVIVVIIATLVIAGVALALILNPGQKTAEIKETAETVRNLSLNETYTKALIDAGADCIVVDGGISKEEMLTLEVLDLSGLGIENLDSILYATNLRELDLSNNNIKDITALAALSKLEKINLSGNPIENFGVLDYLPELKEIIQ